MGRPRLLLGGLHVQRGHQRGGTRDTRAVRGRARAARGPQVLLSAHSPPCYVISNTSQRPLPRQLLHLPQRRAGAGGRRGRSGRGLARGGQVSRDWYLDTLNTDS